MMEKIFAVDKLPLYEHLSRRFILSIFLATSMTACGVVDCDVNAKNFFASPRKEKNFGVISFQYASDSDPYEINIRRVKGGYAMLAPLYEEEGSNIHFTASRTKERKYFTGIESKWSF